ncbi:carboxymuconolactone decarboxylase family protein [Rheinheimera oceanensis]|uniref:carboxymuconolactone decarboxylase family protein n=1 Tax=Rheinheimera oceanensis TaxID=2817449 RepID=UPI001BFD9401|nr:carboxymuconolactone decarboxylase family protein [Rheinheimera oceanensis]
MTPRIDRNDVYKLQPTLVKALASLGEAAGQVIEASLVHLLHLRISQLNGCAFCLHMHAAEARHDGEQQQRLDVLAAWRETHFFSARERAALRWAEALTLLARQQVSDDIYTELSAQFSQQEIVNLSAVIVTMNAWNRIAVGFQFQPQLTAN